MSAFQSTPFSTLHHVCIVVHDIESSLEYYESLGVGPWHDFPPLENYREGLKTPDVGAFMALRYKYCNLGNYQLQLCEPGAGSSPQRKFLDEHGEGVFHLGFTVPSLDGSEPRCSELGLTPWMRGRLPDGSGFTYFNTRHMGAGVTLEIRANKIF